MTCGRCGAQFGVGTPRCPQCGLDQAARTPPAPPETWTPDGDPLGPEPPARPETWTPPASERPSSRVSGALVTVAVVVLVVAFVALGAVVLPKTDQTATPVVSRVPLPTAPPSTARPSTTTTARPTTTTTRPVDTTVPEPPGFEAVVEQLRAQLTLGPAGFVPSGDTEISAHEASRLGPVADLVRSSYRGGVRRGWDIQRGDGPATGSIQLFELADAAEAVRFRDAVVAHRTAPEAPTPHESLPAAVRTVGRLVGPRSAELWLVDDNLVAMVRVDGRTDAAALVDQLAVQQVARR